MIGEWVRESLKDGCLGKLVGLLIWVYLGAWTIISIMLLGSKDRKLLEITASDYTIILIIYCLLYIVVRFFCLDRNKKLAELFEFIEYHNGGGLILGFLLSIVFLIQRGEEVYRSEWIFLLLLPLCGALFLFLRQDSKAIASQNNKHR